MPDKNAIASYHKFLEEERNNALLYQALAENEKNPHLAEVYTRLAQTELRHAEVWVKKIEAAGASVPDFRPTWRTRTLIWLARRFGVDTVLPTAMAGEDAASQDYAGMPEASGMSSEEQSHARLLRQISRGAHGGLEGAEVARLEGRHRTAGGNALRAAVLGANDGLVSNFSLVMGVAGAEMAAQAILLTGLAGLLAGAISMALGEWISVQSSRELYQKQIQIEQEEIEAAPEEEAEELALIYQARGLEAKSARQLAQQIMSDSEGALLALSRDELGIDPQELGGSAWEAALTSFLLFALGAIIPVIPFTFLSGMPAVALSAAFSAVGLFVIGAAITLFTGRSVLASGLRQVVFGLAAALITYLVGCLIGVSVAG
ncbi:MAG: VIT1/CCC1 family protein [Chloroflexota bacterium]